MENAHGSRDPVKTCSVLKVARWVWLLRIRTRNSSFRFGGMKSKGNIGVPWRRSSRPVSRPAP